MKKIYRLFCEGLCTEPSYFRMLERGEHVPLTFNSSISGADPHKLLERARAFIEEERKSIDEGEIEVWIVCDRDQHAHAAKVLDLQPDKIHVAFSNPCFELWLLLHFEFCSKPFHSDPVVSARERDELQDKVGKYLAGLDRDHKVLEDKHYPELANRYEQARKHALRLSKDLSDSNGKRLENTNTNVYELVESVLAYLDRERESSADVRLAEWVQTMLHNRRERISTSR